MEFSTDMITRARTRLMGTVDVPTHQNAKTTSNVAMNLKTVTRNQNTIQAKGSSNETKQNDCVACCF